jgi:3-methyl-2-oxobutanoate hydroxymethyltransferase
MSATNPTTRFSLDDFRRAITAGEKLAMLTCYDYTTARLLEAAGVKLLLVGDSAANVILGYDTTLPIPLDFLIELTAAVRRGAPSAFVMADMPFGSTATLASGTRNVVHMVKRSGCDAVKIECSRGHIRLIQNLADQGIAVFAHLGLTPQSVQRTGYKAQGRSAHDALMIADLASDLINAGASGILLEAVPPEIAKILTDHFDVPVIGCGAGRHCHAHVVVLHDLLGLTPRSPRFAPRLGDGGLSAKRAVQRYIDEITKGRYPKPAHGFSLSDAERSILKLELKHWAGDTE